MAFIYKNNPLNDGTYTVTSNFGYRDPVKTSTGYSTSQHNGIDLGTRGVSVPIFSVADGVVKTVAGNATTGYGYYVVISHDDGVETLYAHMRYRSPLQEGTSISAGTQIGHVGTTGSSTGLHLHFEIKKNGMPIDPARYMSGGVTMLSPDYDASANSVDDSEGNYQGVVDASGVTVGQRVSDVTEQPVHAYVNIYIGENQLLLSTQPPKPNILQSFTYTRLDGAGETAMITLFDDGESNLPSYGVNSPGWDWVELEELLSKYHDHIYIEYGYYGTGKKSQLFKHVLLNYNISFVFTGVILSIETITEGAVKNLNPTNITLNTKNPTEAVMKISESLGYKVLPENFESSESALSELDNDFNVSNTNPITYIQDVIIPAASEEGKDDFSFDLEYDPVSDETIAYFRREGYSKLTPDTNMRTYIYQKGYDSSVIDFSVDIKAVFGGAGTFDVTTGYRSSVFDVDTKTEIPVEADKSSAITVATGDTTHTRSDQSIATADAAGYSPSLMKSRLYHHMKSTFNDSYEATLTIVGDPTIKLFEFIRVINVTDRGYLHHTSGVYLVNGITDSIEDGSMVTVLKLIRNATAGDIDGIEIINPKIPRVK